MVRQGCVIHPPNDSEACHDYDNQYPPPSAAVYA
jgi:hypothetical protein